MLMMGGDKKKMTDSIVESIVGGKKEYSTEGQDRGEACKLCALELIKAIEMKDPGRVISAFQALSMELENESEDEKEGPELEIKF